jgi:hypothetical protein
MVPGSKAANISQVYSAVLKVQVRVESAQPKSKHLLQVSGQCDGEPSKVQKKSGFVATNSQPTSKFARSRGESTQTER